MPKKSKKQLNKEFLAKIATITVGTGGGKSRDPVCDNCNQPLSKHEISAIAIPVPASVAKQIISASKAADKAAKKAPIAGQGPHWKN